METTNCFLIYTIQTNSLNFTKTKSPIYVHSVEEGATIQILLKQCGEWTRRGNGTSDHCTVHRGLYKYQKQDTFSVRNANVIFIQYFPVRWSYR